MCERTCKFDAIHVVDGVARIDYDKCKGCGKCRKNCHMEAISGAPKQPHVIDPEKCINCGACVTICPFGAITASKEG